MQNFDVWQIWRMFPEFAVFPKLPIHILKFFLLLNNYFYKSLIQKYLKKNFIFLEIQFLLKIFLKNILMINFQNYFKKLVDP